MHSCHALRRIPSLFALNLSCRDWVWEHDVDLHLQHLRPRHDDPETPAQQALCQRM